MKQMICLLTVLVVTAVASGAPTDDTSVAPLSVGITGSTPPDDAKNPTAILRSPEVQQLILDIANEPATREKIEAVIADELFTIDDMVNVGLLRQDSDGRFHIDFNLLLVSDQQAILDISERLGRDLAQALMARRDQLEAVAADLGEPHVGIAEVLYGVMGCFSLDWDGLELTEEHGYRDSAQKVIDGHRFTPWAKEKGAEVSLKGLYWGSHNWDVDETMFTTFGDHDALPRLGLPDMMWQLSSAFQAYDEQPSARRAAIRMIFAYLDEPMRDIITVLSTLHERDLTFDELLGATSIAEERLHTILAFLESAEYVGEYESKYGVRVLFLTPDDTPKVRQLIAIGRGVMEEWHERNYAKIRDELSHLTPVRLGVPFERVYTEIWHFVFGIANRTLVEEGLFADPYDEARAHPGFIPMVWTKGITESP